MPGKSLKVGAPPIHLHFAEDPNVESYDEMYMEADEHVGYVESFESFVATDLYGEHVTIVRSKAYVIICTMVKAILSLNQKTFPTRMMMNSSD